MVNTAQLRLPLLMPAQAQKHVTVNEAFAKLDAFAQLRLTSLDLTEPPVGPQPGQSYFVAGESGGAWAGQKGQIATYVNGGWTFTRPLIGWKAWDEEGEACRTFDGTEWVEGAMTVTSSGSATGIRTDEFDHAVEPGVRSSTSYTLPEGAIVFGVTGRVRIPLLGSGLVSWRLGVNESDNRYGSNLGTERNSHVLGITGTPVAYYEPTPLVVTAEDGEFDSGAIRLSVHYICLSVPRPT